MARHRRHIRSDRGSQSTTSSPSTAPREPRPIPGWIAFTVRHGVWITLAAALLTHLIHWLSVRANDPFYAYTVKGFDMHTYWTWARAIVAGDFLSKEFTYGNAFYYGPLYPYFLAIPFKIFGENFDIVHGVQAVLGLLPPLLLYSVARRLFGKAEALATGLLTAFCAPILFYEQLLLMEGLLILIHCAILWTLVRGQQGKRFVWGWALGAGVLSAIACWGRGNFLLVIPLLTLSWGVIPWIGDRSSNEPEGDEASSPEKKPTSPRERRKQRLGRGGILAAAYVAGTIFFLAIPLWRNLHVADDFVVTTSNGPILFYIGNAHDSLGIFSYPASYNALVEQYPSQYDVPWRDKLLRDILDHPGDFVSVLFRKIWMFWNSYDVADNVGYYINQSYSFLMRWSPVTWLTLVPLGLLGVVYTRRDWRRQVHLYVYAIGFSLSIILVFVVGRYRLEEILPLLVWSGAAFAMILRNLWNEGWKNAFVPIVVLAVGIAVLWPTWSPGARLNTPEGLSDALRQKVQLTRVNDYYSNASAFLQHKRNQEGMALLKEAAVAYPWYHPVMSRLSSLYLESGDMKQAIAVLETYLNTVGGDLKGILQLAETQARAGDLASARSNFQLVLQNDPENAVAKDWLDRLKTVK